MPEAVCEAFAEFTACSNDPSEDRTEELLQPREYVSMQQSRTGQLHMSKIAISSKEQHSSNTKRTQRWSKQQMH